MSQGETNPFEEVLRQCAQAAPQPWYPRVFARRKDVSKEDLSEVIEHLLLDGLVERTTGSTETGPGLVLSPRGSKLLQDPERLQRLRNGLPIAEGDRGGVVREVLRRERTPYVSRALLAINVLVFIYGICLAYKGGALQSFLVGLVSQKAEPMGLWSDVMLLNGSITAESWLRGEWWRLLTACFVHIGLLHLGINMYMLWVSGGFVEEMWGRTRFIVIYLISGIVGAGVGLAHGTTIWQVSDNDATLSISQSLAGASFALCGIVAAEAVWVWLNRHHLPRSVLDRWKTNLGIQMVMIVFISFFPGISGWGHFGGAVAGALTALVLNYQRFGPNPWRWVALVALVPISLLGFGEIRRMRMNQQRLSIWIIGISDRGWRFVEELDYEKRFKPKQTEMTEVEQKLHRERVESLLDMDPGRREEKNAELQKGLDFLDFARKQWSGYLDAVNRAGPYYQPPVIKVLDDDRQAIGAHLKLFELEENCLRAGKKWKAEDEAALQKQRRLVKEGKFTEETEKPPDKEPDKPPPTQEREDFKKKHLPEIRNAGKAYDQIWDDANSQVLRAPKDRRDKIVEDRVTRLKAQRQKLTELADKLDQVGPYKDRVADKARKKAIDLLRERATLLAMFQTALEDKKQWTDKEPEEGIEQQKVVNALTIEWQKVLDELGAQ
jgi:membrane associated rhomboid family serine protease